MDETLTEEQDDQLSEVLKVLSKLQTPAIIFESARLRLPDPPLEPEGQDVGCGGPLEGSSRPPRFSRTWRACDRRIFVACGLVDDPEAQ